MAFIVESKELYFCVNGVNFAAQQWGDANGFPVLALHGWLDNSASFFALAPRLVGLNIIAIDMVGQGKSDHRPPAFCYTFWDDVIDVFAIADHFGWQEFSLLGHSRGAIVATLAAGTFPERIKCLALIEGFIPEAADCEAAPQQLADAIKGLNTQRKKSASIYPSRERAVKARAMGMFPLSMTAARA
jgi:pimeloyl-ACP methyl ester carboxylesterase